MVGKGHSPPLFRDIKPMSDVKAIADILEFYKALGFERLPLRIPSAPSLRTGRGVSGPDKAKALEALRREIGECAKCKLSGGRKNLVFGEGNPDARLMFIGEAPGREEDLQGRPFVGDAGRLLTSLIEKLGFSRSDVYIGNIAKCRPPLNRDPEEDEIAACMPHIKKQIKIISPDVIMSLGRVSAQTLIGVKTPISRLRGSFFDFEGFPLMPTFHPAYLLRNPKEKKLVWEDALKALELVREKSTTKGEN